MTSVLFLHSQTLYAKVTIPLALCCLARGWRVTFQTNRPVLFGRSFGFSEKAVTRKPTSVAILNPEAIDYVAGLIGLGAPWRAARKKVRFSTTAALRPGRFDGVVGTTKNMDALRRVAAKGIPAYALGYQHLPVFARVGSRFAGYDDAADWNSVFFGDNPFAARHGFAGILKGCGIRLSTFTFLDEVHARRSGHQAERDQVLIFHPGGYRGVVSEAGESKKSSYAKQKKFLERLCIPLLAKGLKPVIKVHPLRARFHDIEDLKQLAMEVEREHGLPGGSIGLLGPTDWSWDTAYRSALILTFGSSAIYELWSAGLKNVFVCNFQGSARSGRFDFFRSVFLDSYEAYLESIENPSRPDPSRDSLTARVQSAYHEVYRGDSATTSIGLMQRDMGV